MTQGGDYSKSRGFVEAAWSVQFYDGNVFDGDKVFDSLVRAVRNAR